MYPITTPAISFSYFKYSIWLTAKIYPSTLFCSTCPQIYPFMSIPVQYFSLFGITYTVKFPLGTYTQIQPEINVPVYLHTSPLSNNTDLPVTTNTCVPAHRCTLPWPYLFIFILYFRLNAKIYPSTFLQLFMTMLSVYFHVSLSSNHKDLPVTTCTRVPIYIYPFMSYLFIFILQFR